jgi:acyl carrier protein phosphodiesterase
MNYLAHAFLSNNDKNLLVGNFVADHIRGGQLKNFPEAIQSGILLHRRIDTFTDEHPEFRKSKRVFYDGFEKYSGILVDIYFDHLLAKEFDRYSNENLNVFAKKVYKVYSDHLHILPEGSTRFLGYVLQNNIYASYASFEGITKVLFHLSHRIGHNIHLDNSAELFNSNYRQLTDSFHSFFSDAMEKFR